MRQPFAYNAELHAGVCGAVLCPQLPLPLASARHDLASDMDNSPHNHRRDRYEWWEDYYHVFEVSPPRSEDQAPSPERLDPAQEEHVVQELLIDLATQDYLPPRDGPEEQEEKEEDEDLEHIGSGVSLEEGELAEHHLENDNSTRCAGTYEAAGCDRAGTPNDAVHLPGDPAHEGMDPGSPLTALPHSSSSSDAGEKSTGPARIKQAGPSQVDGGYSDALNHPGEPADEGMDPGSPLTPLPHSSSSPEVAESLAPMRGGTSGAQGVLTERPVGATSANGPSAPSAPAATRRSKRLAATTTVAHAPTSSSRRGTRRGDHRGSSATNIGSARAQPAASTTGRARRRTDTPPGETELESSGEGSSRHAAKRRITVVMSPSDIDGPAAKRRK